MPKTGILKDREKEHLLRNDMAYQFQSTIKLQMKRAGIQTLDDLSKIVTVSKSTIYEWMKKPWRMRIENLWELDKVLNFSDEQKAIFRF